ncbi:MAG TPA: substrate-binding domain-containing protein [Victivallales bacterium]|nr:substrate-binding domain-containing protein [Victivallales bacterium]
MRKKLAGLILISLSFIIITSCSKERVSANKIKDYSNTIGFAAEYDVSAFDAAVIKSMMHSAKKYKFKLIVENTHKNQPSNIETLISKKVRCIVVAPEKMNGYNTILAAAREAKIPIIVIDSKIESIPGKEYDVLITANNYNEGIEAARWLYKNTTGDLNVVEITGNPKTKITDERTQGFKDFMDQHNNLKIYRIIVADFSKQEAYKQMKNILKESKNGNIKINAVFAQSDPMAIGAIKAIKEAGLKPGKDIIVIGIDGNKEAKEAIINGELSATITSTPNYGPLVFKNIRSIIVGKKVKPIQYTEGKVYDKYNVMSLKPTY